MTAFAGSNGFNPLPVVAQHSGKETSLSATEQVTIVLHIAVLGQKLLTRLTYLIVLKVQATVFSCHHRLSSAAVVLLYFCSILLCHTPFLSPFLLSIFSVFFSIKCL